jgi:osmotically-inducible protein OsmY
MALTNPQLIADRQVQSDLDRPSLAARDDAKIATAVRAALTSDAAAPEDRIESVVRGGVVSLKGTVDHWYERASAISAVKRLLGVTGVSDHIVVGRPLRTDKQLRLEIKTALDRHFPLEDIDVTVDQGAATLMATVASHRIQQDAEHLAWATTVKTVTNKIQID